MANFWSGLDNWLGNATGWNQANSAQQGREQAQQGVSGAYGGAGTATQYGTQQAGASQAQEGGINQSLGANSGQTIQNAYNAAAPIAGEVAARTGNVAGRQALTAARTAGLNKGQAAQEGGQAGGSAASAAYAPALQQNIGNYMGATQQRMGYQGQLANQGVGGLQTGIGGYTGGAGVASDVARYQGEQGMQGAKNVATGLGSMIPGLAKGGITRGPSLAGEAGMEMIIPVKKLLKNKETARRVVDMMKKETAQSVCEGKALDVDGLIKRIEALEKGGKSDE